MNLNDNSKRKTIKKTPAHMKHLSYSSCDLEKVIKSMENNMEIATNLPEICTKEADLNKQFRN